MVSHFKYLGSVFTSDCTIDAEITHYVAAANIAFQQLRRANVWSSGALTLSVKMHLLQCIMMSVANLRPPIYAYGYGPSARAAVFWRNMGCCAATHEPLGCFSDELLAMHLWHIPA